MRSHPNEYSQEHRMDVTDGFYRFDDLVDRRIVSSRSDLSDKQRKLGFPLPVKPGPKQALFLKTEVHRWAQRLVEKRDAEQRARSAAFDTAARLSGNSPAAEK
jgi:predicted DNA-binding transcriptional regulator AlpA